MKPRKVLRKASSRLSARTFSSAFGYYCVHSFLVAFWMILINILSACGFCVFPPGILLISLLFLVYYNNSLIR